MNSHSLLEDSFRLKAMINFEIQKNKLKQEQGESSQTTVKALNRLNNMLDIINNEISERKSLIESGKIFLNKKTIFKSYYYGPKKQFCIEEKQQENQKLFTNMIKAIPSFLNERNTNNNRKEIESIKTRKSEKKKKINIKSSLSKNKALIRSKSKDDTVSCKNASTSSIININSSYSLEDADSCTSKTSVVYTFSQIRKDSNKVINSSNYNFNAISDKIDSYNETRKLIRNNLNKNENIDKTNKDNLFLPLRETQITDSSNDNNDNYNDKYEIDDEGNSNEITVISESIPNNFLYKSDDNNQNSDDAKQKQKIKKVKFNLSNLKEIDQLIKELSNNKQNNNTNISININIINNECKRSNSSNNKANNNNYSSVSSYNAIPKIRILNNKDSNYSNIIVNQETKSNEDFNKTFDKTFDNALDNNQYKDNDYNVERENLFLFKNSSINNNNDNNKSVISNYTDDFSNLYKWSPTHSNGFNDKKSTTSFISNNSFMINKDVLDSTKILSKQLSSNEDLSKIKKYYENNLYNNSGIKSNNLSTTSEIFDSYINNDKQNKTNANMFLDPLMLKQKNYEQVKFNNNEINTNNSKSHEILLAMNNMDTDVIDFLD